MQRRHLVANLGGATLATVLPDSLRAQPATPPVRLGAIGISFHAVVAGVVQRVLERAGHRVELSYAAHDAMFERLGRGEVDLLAAAWMPGTHSHLFTPVADRIAPVATVYRDARLYWAVPAYVPESDVASVEDLRRPEIAARMERRIRSIGPSAGLSVRSLRMVPEYGLDGAGYSVVPGETAEWVRGFREGYEAQRWMVMPLWQPHFLNRTHAVRILRDPRGVMGGTDDAVVVANRGFLGRLPEPSFRALRSIEIGLDGVTDMDVAVNLRGITALEAADDWLAANAAGLAAEAG